MSSRGFLAAALLALVFPTSAGAWAKTTELVPGVTYTKEVRLAYGGPLVTHVITAPRHGGLYGLRPVLANGVGQGRATVTAMQRRLSGRATLAGVNGDFFSWASGRPSGIFMRDGVLASGPLAGRSSLSVAFDGRLRVERIGYRGSWAVDGYGTHRLRRVNNPVPGPGVVLYTPAWGARTPRVSRGLDVILTGFPPALVDGYLTGRVQAWRRGGGAVIPRGGAVLQARGPSRAILFQQARAGRSVTVNLHLEPWWSDVADAIGGGPVLVRNGSLAVGTDESFTRFQLFPEHPRTAVGQLADGRVILVAVDGRSRASRGVTISELAQEMLRLGAVTAMNLDGGGSTTMAFNGRILNSPSDGRERPVANGLMVFYYGAYAPKPSYRAMSPNGDGAADAQTLKARIVRPSHVDLSLVRPDGRVVWHAQRDVRRATITRKVGWSGMREGKWRWLVSATDLHGRTSQMARSFVVNNSLGHLRLSRERLGVRRGRGGRLGITVRLTRPSVLKVVVLNARGRRVRVLLRPASEQAPGLQTWRWDGRGKGGAVVRKGLFTVRVEAANELGTVSLSRRIPVVRVTSR